MAGKSKNINIKLRVWRQNNAGDSGRFEDHDLKNIGTDMSFLEMFDVLNEKLVSEQKVPVAFEHDCREGICGTCSMVINGQAHGPMKGTTTCQLHMRSFADGATITVEPFRAKSFPVIKDLVVDRSSFDAIIQAGGYISVNTGQAQDANSIPIEKETSDKAMDAAECIGCGACVAACPNSSAMLFTSAKVSHLSTVPQGDIEAKKRVQAMVNQMDKEGFGMCSNVKACEAECPKEISTDNIALMNRQYLASVLGSDKKA